MRRWLVLAGTVACGRIAFDPHVAPSDAVNLTGCADGTREGFLDLQTFPTIAACGAKWPGTLNLRASRTGAVCGDGLAQCASPADACSTGWHVCMDSGDPTDLTSRVTPQQCDAVGGVAVGSYLAAAGHCVTCTTTCNSGEGECTYGSIYTCNPQFSANCAEPICCGADCNNTQNCQAGVFAAPRTKIGPKLQPCGAMPTDVIDGVLCCAD